MHKTRYKFSIFKYKENIFLPNQVGYLLVGFSLDG